MEYEFLGGNLALDFTNTVHDHGADDPGDDLTTAAEWEQWAAQAKLLSGGEVREARRSVDESCFRRALKLRELLYAIFRAAADGKKPDAASLREFQMQYRETLRQQELRAAGSHYHLTWPATMNPLDRARHEIVRSAGRVAHLRCADARTTVLRRFVFVVVRRYQPQRHASLVRHEGMRQSRQGATIPAKSRSQGTEVGSALDQRWVIEWLRSSR